jgi:hypothetical protein
LESFLTIRHNRPVTPDLIESGPSIAALKIPFIYKIGMVLKFLFTRMGFPQQENFMKKRGILLGARCKNGRQIFIYMFRNLFAKQRFSKDNTEENAEDLTLITGLKSLHSYLEKDVRAQY